MLRSYFWSVLPLRMTSLTVFLERLNSRAIWRIPLPSTKWALRTLRMVSTFSISFDSPLSGGVPESMEGDAGVGQFWTPIWLIGGSFLHADQEVWVKSLKCHASLPVEL